MCRWIAYFGSIPVRLDEILVKPEHSILFQSAHAGVLNSVWGVRLKSISGNQHLKQFLNLRRLKFQIKKSFIKRRRMWNWLVHW